MKPTTQARIDRMVAAANSTRFSNDALRELFLSELTQQDRDTRHACAEAAQSRLTNLDTIDPIAAGAIAYQACINTQAV